MENTTARKCLVFLDTQNIYSWKSLSPYALIKWVVFGLTMHNFDVVGGCNTILPFYMLAIKNNSNSQKVFILFMEYKPF